MVLEILSWYICPPKSSFQLFHRSRVIENGHKAEIRVHGREENIAGVRIPVYEEVMAPPVLELKKKHTLMK